VAGAHAAAKPEPVAEPGPAAAVLDEVVDAASLKRRARLGIFVLIGRTVALQLTILGGNVYLARALGPVDYGAFAIVSFALGFFALFGDAGLGASLVQKKQEPTQAEMSSVWWMQVILSSVVIAIVCSAAGVIVRFWPDMPRDATWLLRALSVSLLLTALRIMPTILLERHLDYTRLSILDFVLTIVFYGTAVALAYLGFGVRALVYAVVAQGAVGVVLAYAFRPWRPSFLLDREKLRPMMKFGITYQMKSIVGFVNGGVTPVYAGAVLGRYGLGLVTFAQTTAYFPLKLVEIMGRVNFPLYSRLQGDPEQFAKSLERSVQICAMSTLFFVGLFFGVGEDVVRIIYGEQWLPALPSFYVFTGAISIGFLCPLVAAALDASGRPGVVFRLSIGWTTLNWAVVIGTMFFLKTALAFTVAYCVHVVVGNLAVVLVTRKLIPQAHIWPRVRASILGAAALGFFLRFAVHPWTRGPLTLITAVLVAVVVFTAVMFVLDRSAVDEAFAMIRKKKTS
ncbi:MAG: oligosaccharide flippase family protein, partial [Polyangiales bacterium]